MDEIDALKATIKAQNKKYEKKKAEIQRLKETIQTLLGDDETSTDSETASVNESGDEQGKPAEESDDEEYEDDDDSGLPSPIWNKFEDVFTCVECTWEVVDGECCKCGLKHAWIETPDMIEESIESQNHAIHPDRCPHPRGTTPTRQLTADELGCVPPKGYTPELYWALLQRGVTESMCSNYRLKYSYYGGIWVEFDPSSDLYREMLHPSFHNGLKWRVYLGRQVQLSENDVDGTEFIEGLVEDAMFFPYRDPLSRRHYEVWETVMKTGVWLTRPRGAPTEEDNNMDSDADSNNDGADDEATFDEITKVHNEALENATCLLSRPFMNDYRPDSDDEEEEEAGEEEIEGVVIVKEPEQDTSDSMNVDPQHVPFPPGYGPAAEEEGNDSEEEQSSEEEEDELEDEAAIHLFPDAPWEPDSDDEEGESTTDSYDSDNDSTSQW